MRWLWRRRVAAVGYLGFITGWVELHPEVFGSWVHSPKRGSILLIFGFIGAILGHIENQLQKERERHASFRPNHRRRKRP